MPITLKTFDNPVEAHLLKTRLESEGIWCALHDENTVSINPLYNLTVGGIKLVIDEKDAPLALEILKSGAHHKTDQGRKTERRCPRCRSHHIKPVDTSDKTWFSTLWDRIRQKSNLLWQCKECSRRF